MSGLHIFISAASDKKWTGLGTRATANVGHEGRYVCGARGVLLSFDKLFELSVYKYSFNTCTDFHMSFYLTATLLRLYGGR